MHQFLRDAANAPHASTQSLSHQHLRRAASSNSARTTWLDARMQPDFCAYHLMHAGIAAKKRRALCGIAPDAALQNTHVFSGHGGPRRSSHSERSLLGKWWVRAAEFVGFCFDVFRDSWESLWDSLEWLRVFPEAGLEALLGFSAAEWLEGWFGTGPTSWKGVTISFFVVLVVSSSVFKTCLCMPHACRIPDTRIQRMQERMTRQF